MWCNPRVSRTPQTFALLAFLTLISCPAAAQMSTGRVLLATVVDLRGQPLVDIDADDVVVSEAGQPREVVDVHVADYPVVLLLDDGKDEATGTAIRNAAKRFVERIGERPLAVGLLSGADTMLATFDDARADILERLSSTPFVPTPAAATLPVVAHAAQLIRDTESPFAAIVLVTATRVDINGVDGELLPFIVDTKAPVHVVALSAPPDPATAAAPDLLRGLSEQTRGQYTSIFSSVSFSVALDRLADRLSSEMMISYLVPADGKEGDVRVGVKKPGAIVLGMGVAK